MKKIISLFIFSLFTSTLFAQKIKLSKENLVANQVHWSFIKMEGKEVIKVEFDTTNQGYDIASYVKIKDLDFQNGTIEVKVLSRLQKNAPVSSRGFIGVSFRIGEKDEKFENIYIRPTNGRAEDQIRRNHAIQYFSFPDHKFDKLRETEPEKYESFADMGLNEWVTMRIEVEGQKAKLFINNNSYPSLIVNDMKHGADTHGGIALWVGNWTEAYFKDLKVTKK